MRGACERELCSACPTASERRRRRRGRGAAQAPVPRSYVNIVPVPRRYVFSWSTQKLHKYSSSIQKLRFSVRVPICETPNSLGTYSAIYSSVKLVELIFVVISPRINFHLVRPSHIYRMFGFEESLHPRWGWCLIRCPFLKFEEWHHFSYQY
jgi:hypothetical protein